MWRQLPALAGLLCLTGPAAAHPHGRIDCQTQVQAGPAGLQAIALLRRARVNYRRKYRLKGVAHFLSQTVMPCLACAVFFKAF